MKKKKEYLEAKARLYEEKGQTAIQEQKYTNAFLHFKKAVIYHMELQNFKSAGYCYFIMASISKLLHKDLDEIVSYYKESLALFSLIKERHMQKKLLIRLCEYLLQSLEFRQGEKYAEQLYELVKEEKDEAEYFHAIFLLWWSKKNLEEKSEELDTLVQEEIKKSIYQNNPRLFQDFLYLTQTYDEYLPNFEEELKKSDNILTLGYYYLDKAHRLMNEKKIDEAMTLFLKAHEIACSREHPLLYLFSLLALVIIFDERKEYEKALEKLLVGAASLSLVLGPEVKEFIFWIYNALSIKWGESVFNEALALFKKKITAIKKL